MQFYKGVFTLSFWYFIVNTKKCNQFLYVATLLNSFISPSSFCVTPLGFSSIVVEYCHLLSFAYNDYFTSSLPIWVCFISFSCLIAVARTSKTMLNKSGKSGPPFLISDLRGNTFRFVPLSMVLAVACHVLVWLFVTPWTVTHQAPLSMEFSSQESWGGLPLPPPEGFGIRDSCYVDVCPLYTLSLESFLKL